MEWVDTTNEKDPLTKEGEISCYQPWLEHSVGNMQAKYTIRFNKFTKLWEPLWWHGNRGHGIDGIRECKTLGEAKAVCLIHLRDMALNINSMLPPTNDEE